MELLIATTNSGKFKEVRAYLSNLSLRIVALKDLIHPPTVIEDGPTFEANALKKARLLADFSGLLTLADDSGLEVDALGGAPGICSARYAGDECDDEKNNRQLLRELLSVPEHQRSARFVCTLALYGPLLCGIEQWTVREVCEGRIATFLRGENGFGYDPLFYYPPLRKTFGEIDRETKAAVSHRGRALKRLIEIFPELCKMAKQT